MKFSSNDTKKSKFFTILTYTTAVLTVISIILQAVNQYLILPYTVKSVLNNLIILTIMFLSIALFLLIISILPIFIYKKRKINFPTIKTKKDPLTSVNNENENSSFAKNPIKFFMNSLKDDEIKETLK